MVRILQVLGVLEMRDGIREKFGAFAFTRGFPNVEYKIVSISALLPGEVVAYAIYRENRSVFE